jgi:drug/metabolite transporter (DMT)-like permease
MGDSLNETRKALLLIVVAGVLWGTSFPAIKIGLSYTDAYMLVFWRFLLASAIMFAVLVLTGKFSFELAKRRVLLLGILNGFSYLLQYVGMTYTTASKSSLLVNLTAVWVALLSWVIFKERFGNKKLSGIALATVGVFLVTTSLNFSELTGGMLFGDILVLISGVGWSLFIVYTKKFIADTEKSFQFMTWILFATTLPLIPFVALSSNSSLNLPIEAWGAIAYTAVFCWIVPYYAWLKGLKHASPVVATIVLLTEVIVATVISFVMLDERFTIVSGAGALLILLAIVSVSSNDRAK